MESKPESHRDYISRVRAFNAWLDEIADRLRSVKRGDPKQAETIESLKKVFGMN